MPLLMSQPCVARTVTPAKRTFTFVGEKREATWGGWYRNVRLVNGHEILVGLRKGNRARGMYGVKGFAWYGVVQDKGKTLWSGRVAKSCGVEGMLAAAGLLVNRSVCRPPAVVSLPWILDTHSECRAHRCPKA